MRIAIFLSGFNTSESRLQPWLTLLEVGAYLKAAGHDVWLVTDKSSNDTLALPTKRFKSLRGTESAAIAKWVGDFKPARSVVSVSPFSLATAGWHAALDAQTTWAHLPYALYNAKEISVAWKHLAASARWGFGRNLFIPKTLWRQRLARRFKGVICQSLRTTARIGSDIKCKVISPGLDLGKWQPVEHALTTEEQRTFLYVGSSTSIRGFDVLLEAMRLLPPDICLRVLARGINKTAELQINKRLAGYGLSSRVKVNGGWLSTEVLISEIQHATAVVLPFVLVPSELPVSVMEAIACGIPVIVSDIDGLPETAGSAGLVVSPGNAVALAATMQRLAMDNTLQQSLRKACLEQRKGYQSWPVIARLWADVLEVPL